MLFYGKQNINQADIDAVRKTLLSDFLTQGPAVEQFEKKVAAYCGARYAVAVSNATAALHIACLAAGLSESDILWTSPNTFVASANCGRYCGADVDFVDICGDDYNMSAAELEKKLRSGKKTPKVVVPVHFAGQSCNMRRIYELSQLYGFTVIEDASHAIGGTYQGEKVGSCKFSDMAVFSFHPVKIITTGEGGMVVTNRRDLFEKLLLYRCHGITRNIDLMQGKSDGPWYYEQIDLGFNYRMTDLQAALGISQMDRLDEFVRKRRYLADRYNHLLMDLPVQTPRMQDAAASAWHLYVVRLDFNRIHKDKITIYQEMRDRDIALNVHYIPVHLQPYYKNLGFVGGDFPTAETYYREAITLPLFYALTDHQQDHVVQSLKEVLS